MPDTSDTNVTRVRQATRVLQNDASAAGVKIFDFDSGTSKDIVLHPYIYYMASERLQGEEQFRSKYYLPICLILMPKCV